MVKINLQGEDISKIRRQQFEVSIGSFNTGVTAFRQLLLQVKWKSAARCVRARHLLVPRPYPHTPVAPRPVHGYRGYRGYPCSDSFSASMLPLAGRFLPHAQNWRNQQEITSRQRADISQMERLTAVEEEKEAGSKWKVRGSGPCCSWCAPVREK